MKKAAFAAALLFLSSSSRAQHAVTNSSRSELLRVLASESRWDAPRSAAAMLHVLQRHADRNSITIVESANAIVWPFSNAQYEHPWTRYLSESCDRPDYYRGQWPREKCLRLVQLIQDFQEGVVKDPCKGAATGWRSPKSKALRYALAHGFARVRCVGGTSLAFVQSRKVRPHAKRSKKSAQKEEGATADRRGAKAALRHHGETRARRE